MQSDSNEHAIHRNDKHFDKIDAAAAAALHYLVHKKVL